MKISTKGRYALRLLLDIAQNQQDGFVSLKEIAERQEVSKKYLEQIISILNKAGFVKSARGANGGYRLSREPKDYTVGMILNVMEGTLSPVPCLDYETNTCPRSNACITLDVWRQIHEAVQNVVDNITLADLVEKYHAEYGDEEIAPCYDQDMKQMLS